MDRGASASPGRGHADGRVAEAGSSLRTTWSGLPVGSDCVVTETAAGGAAHVSAVVTVDGVVTTSQGARVPVVGLAGTTEPGAALVELTNTFEARGGLLASTGAAVLAAGVVALLLVGGGAALLAVRRRTR